MVIQTVVLSSDGFVPLYILQTEPNERTGMPIWETPYMSSTRIAGCDTRSERRN